MSKNVMNTLNSANSSILPSIVSLKGIQSTSPCSPDQEYTGPLPEPPDAPEEDGNCGPQGNCHPDCSPYD